MLLVLLLLLLLLVLRMLLLLLSLLSFASIITRHNPHYNYYYAEGPSSADNLPVGCLLDFQYTTELTGWHASYFFNTSGIENKLRSFWHAHDPATKAVRLFFILIF